MALHGRATSAPALLNVRFRVAMTRPELVEAFMQDAPALAKLPDLRWKIWAFDDARREFASVYLFDDLAAARAFAAGDVIRGLQDDPNLADVRVEVHEVLEGLSAVTRAPLR